MIYVYDPSLEVRIVIMTNSLLTKCIYPNDHVHYCGTSQCIQSLHTYILSDVSLLFCEYEPENPFVERTILHLYLPINSYNNIMLLYNVIIFSVCV